MSAVATKLLSKFKQLKPKWIKLLYLRKQFPDCLILSSNIADSVSLGRRVAIYRNVDIRRNVSIGNYSYINNGTIVASGTIGKYCSIGFNVQIGMFEHPVNYVTTSEKAYHLGNLGWKEIHTPPRIGNDVWIGSNTIILQNVIIGNGAVIGAGAVVTKNVEPYEIVGGVPAKTLKNRFPKQIIEELEKIQWWDKPDEWVKIHANLLNDVEEFVTVCKNE